MMIDFEITRARRYTSTDERDDAGDARRHATTTLIAGAKRQSAAQKSACAYRYARYDDACARQFSPRMLVARSVTRAIAPAMIEHRLRPAAMTINMRRVCVIIIVDVTLRLRMLQHYYHARVLRACGS